MSSRIFLLLVLFLTTFSRAQFPEFRLAGARTDGLRDHLRAVSLTLGHHPAYRVIPARRLQLGLSAARPHLASPAPWTSDRTGLVPAFEGAFLVTSNFFLTGTVSGFSSGGDVVQFMSYGADLVLERDPGGPAGTVSVSLGILEGPADLRLRLWDILYRQPVRLWCLPLLAGAGFNSSTSRITRPAGLEPLPGRVNTQVAYLYGGLPLSRATWQAGIHIRLHPELVLLSVDVWKGMP